MDITQYELSQKILGPGVHYVYPGHPVTIAMFIMHAFPTFASADSREEGADFKAALCSGSVPGGGGNVHSALAMLTRIKSGEHTPQQALAWADESWGRCDGQKELNPKNYQEGVEEAAKLTPAFLALISEWIGK